MNLHVCYLHCTLATENIAKGEHLSVTALEHAIFAANGDVKREGSNEKLDAENIIIGIYKLS